MSFFKFLILSSIISYVLGELVLVEYEMNSPNDLLYSLSMECSFKTKEEKEVNDACIVYNSFLKKLGYYPGNYTRDIKYIDMGCLKAKTKRMMFKNKLNGTMTFFDYSKKFFNETVILNNYKMCELVNYDDEGNENRITTFVYYQLPRGIFFFGFILIAFLLCLPICYNKFKKKPESEVNTKESLLDFVKNNKDSIKRLRINSELNGIMKKDQ